MGEDVMLNSDIFLFLSGFGFFFFGGLQLTGSCGTALESILKSEVLYTLIRSLEKG